MKKVIAAVKVTLFASTLAVVGLSAFPQGADAAPGDIWIFCEDRANVCVIHETEEYTDFYLGRLWGIGIEQ